MRFIYIIREDTKYQDMIKDALPKVILKANKGIHLKKAAGRGTIKSGSLSAKQRACIIAAAILAALSLIPTEETKLLNEKGVLLRDEPGGTDRTYELLVGGMSDSYETVTVTVSPREYSEEEAYELFELLMEEMSAHIIGSNESLDSIDADLIFQSEVKGYEGISISFYPEDIGLIANDGSVNNLYLEEPANTAVKVVLKTGEYRQEYLLPVTVVPVGEESEADRRKKIEDMIKTADLEQIRNDSLKLPEDVYGMRLNYSAARDFSWFGILCGGVFAVMLLGLKPEQDKINMKKLKERELLKDYSDVVSKLIVYMGAGLTVRNAWTKISDEYKRELESGHSERRAAYDEMAKTADEIRTGVPELKAYSEFGRRCSLKSYMKLVSILEQNMKTGDKRSEEALKIEMQEAFEFRKNLAKRQGEEASAKLTLPLMISLAAVLAITAMPAMISMM